MPWKSTAISVGGSLLGGLMGGSKKASRASSDAAARAQYELDLSKRVAADAISPYANTGREANNKLADLLGIAIPNGYAKRPELQDFNDQLRAEHFRSFRKDYTRKSDFAGQNIQAKNRYDRALANWESGLKDYQDKNPNSRGSGDLLKNFSNDDFVRDPGYVARLLEGEQGEQRNLIARGASDSGQALKELERYRQTYASNEFGNAYNRDADNKTRTYNFLSGQTSQGLNAAQGIGNLAFNTASQNGRNSMDNANNMLNQKNLRDENRGNAFQSALGNLIYGMNRGSGTPPYVPSTGGYSSPRAGSFASQFVG